MQQEVSCRKSGGCTMHLAGTIHKNSALHIFLYVEHVYMPLW